MHRTRNVYDTFAINSTKAACFLRNCGESCYVPAKHKDQPGSAYSTNRYNTAIDEMSIAIQLSG